MDKPVKLDAAQKHLLRLIVQDTDADGWTVVSEQVFPIMKRVPSALIVLEYVGDDGRGRARLTHEGQMVIDAMPWLGG